MVKSMSGGRGDREGEGEEDGEEDGEESSAVEEIQDGRKWKALISHQTQQAMQGGHQLIRPTPILPEDQAGTTQDQGRLSAPWRERELLSANAPESRKREVGDWSCPVLVTDHRQPPQPGSSSLYKTSCALSSSKAVQGGHMSLY